MHDVESYVKDRNKMLKTLDVNEYRKFVEKYKKIFTRKYVSTVMNSSDEVLEVAMRKAIIQIVNMPKKLKEESKTWLIERGFSLEL